MDLMCCAKILEHTIRIVAQCEAVSGLGLKCHTVTETSFLTWQTVYNYLHLLCVILFLINFQLSLMLSTKIVGQGQVAPVHTFKAYGGSNDIASVILNLSTRWRWGSASFIRVLYCLGKSPQHRSSTMLGGWQSWTGCLEKREISCFCWESNYNSAVAQLVANWAVLASQRWWNEKIYSSELTVTGTVWLPARVKKEHRYCI
jgi:hypothetical protein